MFLFIYLSILELEMSTVTLCPSGQGIDGRQWTQTCSTSFQGLRYVLRMQPRFLSIPGRCPATKLHPQFIVGMAQSSHICLFMLLVYQRSCVSEMAGIRQHRRRTQSYSERWLEAKAVSLSPGKNKDIYMLVGACFMNVNFGSVINHFE